MIVLINLPIDLKSSTFLKVGVIEVSHNCIDPFQLSVAFHIGTSHSISTANQTNGFYVK